MASLTNLVLFGPQQGRWTYPRLQTLQSHVRTNPTLHFLRDCVSQLEAFLATTPLGSTKVTQSVGPLTAFAQGTSVPQPDTLSNAQLAVLTVVAQAVDWIRYAADRGDVDVVQGFCIGFLSAAVISSTQNRSRSEFELYIANAIRLAACLGLLVDAENAAQSSSDRAAVISVRCNKLSERTVLDAVLESCPQAYTSCITDDRAVTVTLPHHYLEDLTRRLERESISVKVVALNGSYHHSKHIGVAQQLKTLCARTPDLQLPSTELLTLPLRSTADTELVSSGALHDIAIDLILCKRAHWFETVKRAMRDLPNDVKLISMGLESHIPRSLSGVKPVPPQTPEKHTNEEIAVIGMSCRFPQADTLEEFWQLISSGGTAFGTLPLDRFDPSDLRREPKLPIFWGNFLRRPDVFDHRFFGISGREAKSMDPQQRLALQVAYEAMETSGYNSLPISDQEKDVGCYLGVGAVDYEGNVASENANAFSATGTLRAFIAGRISHFFGWSGPSMTFDTACSSSAVAISTACKALLAGDCAIAIAGGVNVITSPNLHQNLAAASFLNPNGSSRAFDASAAGYSRGEGAGIIVLKPLSKALDAGDNILAVIAGSAVNQGSNLSSITVPDSQSQCALYRRALSTARIEPNNVHYVEAHGTGTQVGDPIEYESTIPKQANFATLNPRIKASDRIQVPEVTREWRSSQPVALLNNYGASGNNAAIVLRAFEQSLPRNAEPRFILRRHVSVEDLASALMRHQNPSFEYRAAVSTGTARDLVSDLDSVGHKNDAVATRAVPRSIILVFGGQTGRTVVFSKELYEASSILRLHLVSYAKTWLDCGVKVDSLIGHSFGQISALCVANSITLKDAFRLIAGRARLVRDNWGLDCGAMLSIECNRADAEGLVDRAKAQDGCRINVACYNGPRSFVLAGDTHSINWVEEECKMFRTARLFNTHAYHSYMADSILDDYKNVAASITIRPPQIRIETCSQGMSWNSFTASEIVAHTRQPVYFSEAVQRVADRLPTAIWLEAGSGTPIISMTRRILAQSEKAHRFLATDLGKTDATANLANTCCELWMAGCKFRIPFWPAHDQRNSELIDLPPYQFEQTQHWIQYRHNLRDATTHLIQPSDPPTSNLVTISGDGGKDGEYSFTVNTSNSVFKLATSGHAVAGQSLCPASMYIELATQSALLLLNSQSEVNILPHIENLVMSAPLGLGVKLFINLSEETSASWRFSICSETMSKRTEHGRGTISLPSVGDIIVETRLKLLQKMVSSSSMDRIFRSSTATSIRGNIVYQLFSQIVDYAAYYRGVRSVSALGNEAVGLIDLSDHANRFDWKSTVSKPIELDNFLQVAGIHVNCLSPRQNSEVFMCTAVDEVILAPSFAATTTDTQGWKVYTCYETGQHGTLVNNIFVFDATDTLMAAILGATFRSVSFNSLARTLTRLNQLDGAIPIVHKQATESSTFSGYHSQISTPSPRPHQGSMQSDNLTVVQQPWDILHQLRALLSDIIEVPVDNIQPSSSLDDLGIDSLLITEVVWEIQQRLKIRVTQEEILSCNNVLSLSRVLEPHAKSEIASPSIATEALDNAAMPQESVEVVTEGSGDFAHVVQECFSAVKYSYDAHAQTTGLSAFYTGPFLMQSQLVIQYVLDAFAALGCDLKGLNVGQDIPIISHVDTQRKLIPQLYKILEDARLIAKNEEGAYQRTRSPLTSIPASTWYNDLLSQYPQHTSETKLLHKTGSRLADCLSGAADPISLIFRDSSARGLLEDVYTNAPMFKAGTLLLAEYLSSIIKRLDSGRQLNILELGAGTGGTTKAIISELANAGCSPNLTYTFSDLSSSMVASARRKFAKWKFMRYDVLDIEQTPTQQLLGHYDIVLSTNCIHATKNLSKSTEHIRQMLKPDGILCLVELTRNLFWFDLVFGLLSGWWLFNDGRSHVLADERLWETNLRKAAFKWIDWSEGASRESALLRVITASPFDHVVAPVQKETLVFKKVDGLELEADLYYPAKMAHSSKPLPVVTLTEGPMADVADALNWVQKVLPNIRLRRGDIEVDGSRVISVGWSTGGTLALSLGWTSIDRGINPPKAILVFYCPLDYEDDFWLQPNIPIGSKSATSYELDGSVWTAVSDRAMTRWNVPPSKRALGGWMAPTDARSRLALYMNWHGRTLHVLLRGLDVRTKKEPQAPTAEEIQAVSPLAQVRHGNYCTPTFIVHPRNDDLIPWEQAQRMHDALRNKGIESHLQVVDGVPHLFDMYSEHRKRSDTQKVICQGYEFLLSHVA
ncbi:hypothetical protein SNOG_06682 [Parastagonospora nodorum SN15]|uniref:Uncharacterized protein n=1 Tax=Phaeosphaeria nodorum (strain SN15 / ATCC MYA-4574 / FGSC 10173) TaxID=321614 RepID=Q0UNI2_PHANO|nr:hypothetical protein SNOG_06682 [Parastagonospora nodorum SN15]EAT86513.1 hypothetical protein SNOG_06682 [Parastagonospora nodorum SN15]